MTIGETPPVFVTNLTNDYYRPTDQREVMTIIDPLTVVNRTSCYSVDSRDSCSSPKTPEVFALSVRLYYLTLLNTNLTNAYL